MRQIKFRAILNQEAQTTGEYDSNHRYFTLEDLMRGKFVFSFPEHWSFTQFTGFKDIDGVDIYEGDIIEYIDSGEGYTDDFIEPVKWDDEKGCFCTESSSCVWEDVARLSTILGNIYEKAKK